MTPVPGQRCEHGFRLSDRCPHCEPVTRPKGSVSGAPSITRAPHCGRCGTGDIVEGARFCSVCGPIMEARLGPQASVILDVKDGKPPEPEGL